MDLFHFISLVIFFGGNSTLMSVNNRQEGVCHIVALPFPLKSIFKAKDKIMETQICHHAKI